MTIAERQPTAPTPTDQELVARARALLPLLRKNAAEGEQNRRVLDESIQAMEDAGLFKIVAPKRYGGYETSIRTMLEVSSTVAEGDGATAWVLGLTNVCVWLIGLYPERAQSEVFAKENAKVCGVLTPTATTVKVEGGFRVTGKWGYNTGSMYADWVVMGIPIVDGAGNMVDQGCALMPRADLEMEETWFVSGMKGSGSNTLIADDVFVPNYRVVSVPGLMMGQSPSEHLADEPLYRAALVSVLALILVGPQLGLGRAALNFVIEKAPKKAIAYTGFTQQSKSTAFQLEVAKAALMIDTAHLHAFRAAKDIDDAAQKGEMLDLTTRARIRADTGWAAEHITKAIDMLMSAHGSGGFAEASPLQRMWRDSNIAARHAMVLPMVNYELYGKVLLDDDAQITPLI